MQYFIIAVRPVGDPIQPEVIKELLKSPLFTDNIQAIDCKWLEDMTMLHATTKINYQVADHDAQLDSNKD